MKFIHYLEKVSGIDIYGLSSFLLFMSFFIIILAWAIKADNKTIDEISRIPLD